MSQRPSTAHAKAGWESAAIASPSQPASEGSASPRQTPGMHLRTSAELTVDVAEAGTVRLGWGEGDWFGPGRPTRAASVADPVEVSDDLGTATSVTVVDDGAVRCSVRAYADRPLVVFRTEALTDVVDLATGAFDQPSVGGRWGSRKKPSRSASTFDGRPNSQCWNARARRPSGAPPSARSLGVKIGHPTEGWSNAPVARSTTSVRASVRNTTSGLSA